MVKNPVLRPRDDFGTDFWAPILKESVEPSPKCVFGSVWLCAKRRLSNNRKTRPHRGVPSNRLKWRCGGVSRPELK